MPEDIVGHDVAADIRTRVRDVIRSLAPETVDHVDRCDRLQNDLLFDSLALVELAVRLEQEFELPPFEGEAVDLEIETVGDVEDLIDDLVKGGRE